MSIRKIKRLSAVFLTVLMLTIVSVFIANAAYTQGTVTVGNGWWKGKYTTAGSNSVPSYGTFTTTSVSTSVSLASTKNRITNNSIWGYVNISQYGSIVLSNHCASQHVYSGNRVASGFWNGVPTTVYGQ